MLLASRRRLYSAFPHELPGKRLSDTANRGPSEAEQTVLVPEARLDALGWRRLVACSAADAAPSLGPLLGALRDEDCVHSWKAHLPPTGPCDVAAVTRLLAAERARRPTVAFAYIAEAQTGGREVVAVGCVSSRLRADLSAVGFPVLARCFVRRQWRGRGLYRAVLSHRLAWCEARWGAELRAVHLGTADPAVWKVATTDDTLGPPFLHIGDEDLVVGDDVHAVHDLLRFSSPYAACLLAEARALEAAPGGAEAGRRLQQLVQLGLPACGAVGLEAALAESSPAAQAVAASSPGLEALLMLTRAIPVTR